MRLIGETHWRDSLERLIRDRIIIRFKDPPLGIRGRSDGTTRGKKKSQ